MSELPWENKKIAEIMSSAGDEAKLSPDASTIKKGATPPIPDILANAFADMQMEEAKIDTQEPASDVKFNQLPEMSFPSFGDLPDLSVVGQNKSEEPTSNPVGMSFPPSLPSFMNAPGIPETPDPKEGTVNDIPKTLFAMDNSKINNDPFPDTSPKIVSSPKKRSPPPLFDPFIPGGLETDLGNDPEPPATNMPEFVANNPTSFPPSLSSSENLQVSGINQFANTPNDSPSPFFDGPIAGANSIEATPSVGTNPFDSTPSGGANPFQAPHTAGVNPFDAPPTVGANPFEVPAAAGVNPFDAPSTVGANPFDAPSTVGANPFEVPPDASVNPFEAPPAAGVNPFGESFQSAEKSVNGTSNGKVSIKPPINVDSFKKNIEGISVVARGFLKNLTKGKSLIQRMEDMMGGTVSEDFLSANDAKLSVSESPFEHESDRTAAPSPVNPFSAFTDDLKETPDDPRANPFDFDKGPEHVEAIRKVTPIENPVMEMDQKYSLDEDVSNDPLQKTVFNINPEISDIGSDFVEITAFDKSMAQDAENNVDDASRMGLSGIISAKSNGMIADKRYAGIESDIDELKGNLKDMGMQFTSVCGEVEIFSNKVSYLDETLSSFAKASEDVLAQDLVKFADIEEKMSSVGGKVGNFESNLAVIQSDNTSIKSDLLRLEDNVSELVNCYTALLAQMHESLQENESNFSRIDDVSGKLDVIGSRISSMEKSHEDTKSTSMEFSRSISALIDNLGMVSSEFKEFQQESEQKNAAMLEKICSVTEYVEAELKKLGAKSYKGFGQNVHLSNIVKNSGNMKLCMEWLEFLMGLVGRNNLPDILSYYEELGWITEKVRMELLHYAEGIDFYMEKPDWKLTPDDHVKSIWFIESLAGMKVDKNRLSVIDRDIEKVKKGSEIYGI
ncbi:FlaD/FlaE family flagellar protein [Methanolobus mangrovi]|uniref:FlaD/FlaE family flagellar protein n=1 Tax=Methanolobus mangrovi TaxID=3072977 RepID=A0AA51YGN2_9EURY|nr:FlaD/FlaE family flagellar protein [Methanolobus mangrovi]WMW22232.1 FlaD/FlaE family flagellar protein [Methanolobus mangrovi]